MLLTGLPYLSYMLLKYGRESDQIFMGALLSEEMLGSIRDDIQ